MELSFDLADLISLIVIVSGMVGTYWKLSSRMSLAEVQVQRLEKDIIQNKRDAISEASKLEHKLDTISQKIETLLIEVGRLQSK